MTVSKEFVVLAMIFAHILDDYVLQGILANMKQRSWWEKNAPDPMYRYDYLVALAMHSMSWSFMVSLPAAAYHGFNIGDAHIAVFVVNSAAHAVIDDLKANRRVINLVADQTIHMLQIAMTAFLLLA